MFAFVGMVGLSSWCMVVNHVILVTLSVIILVVLLRLRSFLGFVGVVLKLMLDWLLFVFVALIVLEASF